MPCPPPPLDEVKGWQKHSRGGGGIQGGGAVKNLAEETVTFFLMGNGLLKVQRMGTSPFHSPKVSAHKKLSAVF